MVETTTVTVSEALKEHLNAIKADYHKYSVDGVSTLHGAMEWLINEGYDEQISIEGYDETLEKPIKVPLSLFNRVRELKEEHGFRDREELLRELGNIEHRDRGEEPIEVTKI